VHSASWLENFPSWLKKSAELRYIGGCFHFGNGRGLLWVWLDPVLIKKMAEKDEVRF
jgi:hypothetical protein